MKWVQIIGFEGLYEASDSGIIRSVDRVVPHSYWGKIKRKGCILTPAINATRNSIKGYKVQYV